MLFNVIFGLAATGAAVGFLSGLLGSGGTTFLVPVLSAFFAYYLSLHGSSVHFAVFTALTISALTSLSNMIAYLKQRLISIQHLCSIVPYLLITNIIGLLCSTTVPAFISGILFAVFLLYLSYSIFIKQKQGKLFGRLPLMSSWVGFQSGLLGISGGSIAFSYLSKTPIRVEQSIALATLITFIVSLTGLIIGLTSNSHIHLVWTTGFIYWPAVVLITPFSA